jgi:predicted dehydrogenase
VYLARAIMGRGQPRRVDARIAQTPLGTGDVEDVATLTLEWEDGAHAVLHLSWGDGTSGDSTIHGPGGALKISYPSGNSAPHNVATGVAQLTGRDEQLMHPLDWQRFPLTWYYGGSIASFADACAGRGDAFSFADGRDDLEVGLAAYLSSATERPVELPLPPSHPVYQYGALGVRRLELSPTSPVLRDGLFQPATS